MWVTAVSGCGLTSSARFDDRQTLFIVPAAEHGESFLGIVSEFLRLGGHWKTYWTIVKPPA
jgi:hypothetical protein